MNDISVATIITVIIAAVTMLLGILGYFIKTWMNDLKCTVNVVRDELKQKVDNTLCLERLTITRESVKSVDVEHHEALKEAKGDNKKDHDEIFERLRKTESVRGL